VCCRELMEFTIGSVDHTMTPAVTTDPSAPRGPQSRHGGDHPETPLITASETASDACDQRTESADECASLPLATRNRYLPQSIRGMS